MATNPPQLFLLADHVKLSLLERQRAVSLNLPSHTQDSHISRSLEQLRAGIESLESQVADTPDEYGPPCLPSLHPVLIPPQLHNTPAPAPAHTAQRALRPVLLVHRHSLPHNHTTKRPCALRRL